MSKEKKSSGFGKVLLTSILSLGIGAGGYWYYENNIANASVQSSADSQDKNNSRARPAAPVAPIFYEMEPFTVTLPDSLSSRILHVGLTVQLQDQASSDRLERYLPVVRNRIITELSDVPASALGERETKDAIRAIIAQTLEAPFGVDHQPQNIADVLFSAFVVQ